MASPKLSAMQQFLVIATALISLIAMLAALDQARHQRLSYRLQLGDATVTHAQEPPRAFTVVAAVFGSGRVRNRSTSLVDAISG